MRSNSRLHRLRPVGAFLLLYFLCSGPADVALSRGYIASGSHLRDALEVAYFPLKWLSYNFVPFGTLLISYLNLWYSLLGG